MSVSWIYTLYYYNYTQYDIIHREGDITFLLLEKTHQENLESNISCLMIMKFLSHFEIFYKKIVLLSRLK